MGKMEGIWHMLFNFTLLQVSLLSTFKYQRQQRVRFFQLIPLWLFDNLSTTDYEQGSPWMCFWLSCTNWLFSSVDWTIGFSWVRQWSTINDTGKFNMENLNIIYILAQIRAFKISLFPKCSKHILGPRILVQRLGQPALVSYAMNLMAWTTIIMTIWSVIQAHPSVETSKPPLAHYSIVLNAIAVESSTI